MIKQNLQEEKRRRQEVKVSLLASTLYQDDPDRIFNVEFCQGDINIDAIIHLFFSENKLVRHLISVMDPTFYTQGLHHKAVRKISIETFIYILQ